MTRDRAREYIIATVYIVYDVGGGYYSLPPLLEFVILINCGLIISFEEFCFSNGQVMVKVITYLLLREVSYNYANKERDSLLHVFIF